MIISIFTVSRNFNEFRVKMANRTAKDAHTIKGTNPQYLVEKIIRLETNKFKANCF